MKKNNLKLTACALAAVIGFTGTGIEAEATGNVASVLPSAGIEFFLQEEEKTTSLSSVKEEAEAAEAEAMMEKAENDDDPESKESEQEEGDDSFEVEGISVGSAQVGVFSDMASTSNGISKKSTEKKIIDTVVVSEGYTRDLKAMVGGLSEEEESFKNLVIAKVNDYVNVRDIPSEDGEIVGKLYNKSVGSFIEEEDGWYKIREYHDA